MIAGGKMQTTQTGRYIAKLSWALTPADLHHAILVSSVSYCCSLTESLVHQD